MKNQTTILTVLGLTAVILVVSGCPRHHRPHAPHPHRLPHPHLLQPADVMLEIEQRVNAALPVSASSQRSG